MSVGYDVFDDPYCYKGTTTLKNKLGLRNPALLESFELEMTALRANEALPRGEYDPRHYRRVHHHLFQDVYRWAGKYRTVRTSKAGNPFCFPEYIEKEMNRLFATLRQSLAAENIEQFVDQATRFLADLNAIHPFREGNGRGQLAFMSHDRRARWLSAQLCSRSTRFFFASDDCKLCRRSWSARR